MGDFLSGENWKWGMKTAIGIDLGGTNMRVALVHESGEVRAIAKRRTPTAEGPEQTAIEMTEMIDALKAEHTKAEVLGVGIGSPGPLSRTEKMIFQTPNLPGFDCYPLGKKVEELSGHPVWLDNDAKCATYGEGLFGVARGLRNYILLTFGTGIGSGIIVDGKMIYGKSDGACETGHMTLYPEGLLCKCGNRGCFEQYCSATAIHRRAGQVTGREITTREVFLAFEAGEAWAKNILSDVAHDLAVATASLVNIFDPEAVVFGGGVFTTGGGPLVPRVRELIKTRCFKSSQQGLRIEASTLTGNAGVLGAASLVFRDQ
jgi:glucokinase